MATEAQSVVEQAPAPKAGKANPMRALRVRKVTVNIGVGEAGDRLEKAERVLQALANRKPVRTLSTKTIRDWGLRDGMPIGCKVTLRGKDADAFVKRALWPRNNRVPEWAFDKHGNLQFGVADHTGMEGQKYDPDIGVFGMDVAITVERQGFRIKRRRLLRRRVPSRHQISRQESIEFLRERYALEVV